MPSIQNRVVSELKLKIFHANTQIHNIHTHGQRSYATHLQWTTTGPPLDLLWNLVISEMVSTMDLRLEHCPSGVQQVMWIWNT